MTTTLVNQTNMLTFVDFDDPESDGEFEKAEEICKQGLCMHRRTAGEGVRKFNQHDLSGDVAPSPNSDDSTPISQPPSPDSEAHIEDAPSNDGSALIDEEKSANNEL